MLQSRLASVAQHYSVSRFQKLNHAGLTFAHAGPPALPLTSLMQQHDRVSTKGEHSNAGY